MFGGGIRPRTLQSRGLAIRGAVDELNRPLRLESETAREHLTASRGGPHAAPNIVYE